MRPNFVSCLHARQSGLHNNTWEHLLSRQLHTSKHLYSKDVYGHYGCVNVVEFSPDDRWLASGGDDRNVLLWKIGSVTHNNATRKHALDTQHLSNIFCLQFEHNMEHILSAGNDDRIIRHNLERNASRHDTIYTHDEPVYGISLPMDNDHIFATASENGSVQVWDFRCQEKTMCLALSSGCYHACAFNPMDSRLVAAANAASGTELYDIRCPYRPLLRYGIRGRRPQSAMSVCFNHDGTQLLSLARRTGPVLYDTHSSTPVCTFTHDTFKNACTMKSVCFAGEADEFVVSGSDDSGVYMWKTPQQNSPVALMKSAHIVLRGHRSIVNQVRYNKKWKILATAGVEKVVKLWSQLRMPGFQGDEHLSLNSHRASYAADDYIEMFLRDDLPLNHNYEDGNTAEDPRMIAFFDSLIERVHSGAYSDNTTSEDDATDDTAADVMPDLQSSPLDENVEANVLDRRRLLRR